MSTLTRAEKLGMGAYGKVYKAYRGRNGSFAVKINLLDSRFTSSFCIKELDINLSLKHTYISSPYEVSYGNPFGTAELLSPLAPEKTGMHGGMCPDDIHFVYPLAKCDLNKYLYDCRWIDTHLLCEFMMQMMLALDYVHANGILHRDVKIDNFLIFEEGGRLVCKLSDFGISKRYAKYQPSSPMLVLPYCRAPECARVVTFHDLKADVWALACVFHELISKTMVFDVPKSKTEDRSDYDTNKFLLSIISIYLPVDADAIKRDYPLSTLNSSTDDSFIVSCAKRKQELINLGCYDSFITMMKGMFRFNPEERWSTTQCLDSAFFDRHRSHINFIRSYHTIPEEELIRLPPSSQKNIADDVMYRTYERRGVFKWYTHRIFFHSMTFFTRVLLEIDVPVNKIVLYFRAVLYMFIKYFHNILRYDSSIPFANIDPERHITVDEINDAREFERKCILLMGGRIYRTTLYEKLCQSHAPTEEDIYGLIVFYVTGRQEGKTLTQAYDEWNSQRKKYSEGYHRTIRSMTPSTGSAIRMRPM